MGGSGWGVRVDVNQELKFFGKLKKIQKKNFFFKGGGGGGGLGWGGQGGCESRIEVFWKIKEKKIGGWGGGWVHGGSGWM